jgi:hypothetical protein
MVGAGEREPERRGKGGACEREARKRRKRRVAICVEVSLFIRGGTGVKFVNREPAKGGKVRDKKGARGKSDNREEADDSVVQICSL